MRSNALPRSASAPLEDSTGASHVVEGGVCVEMVKIESDPNFKIGPSNETSSSARSCRCRAVSVDRSIAVSRERCPVMGSSSGYRIAEMHEEPKKKAPDEERLSF